MSSTFPPSMPTNDPPSRGDGQSESIAGNRSGDQERDEKLAQQNEHNQAQQAQSAIPSPDLVEQTRQQIQRLTNEIQTLSQSDVSLSDFYQGFIARVTSALASQGGAIWLFEAEQLNVAYQVSLPEDLLTASETDLARHHKLVHRIAHQGDAVLVPPQSGATNESEDGNPTDNLLVIAPLRVDEKVVGLVEIFQRAGSGPTTQRGYLRFLLQMVDHAATFLKNHALTESRDRQVVLERLDEFITEIHADLDLKPTAFAIANEGRKVTEVDRVALAVAKGRGYEIMAVSGLDSVERRSNEIKWLNRLIDHVCQAGIELWYDGDDSMLAPQIEEPLHEYLDQSHTKRLALVPLYRSRREDHQDVDEDPIGCLVIEQIGQMTPHDRLRGRVDAMSPHAARALSNAFTLNQLPFARTLRGAGAIARTLNAQNLPTTLLVAAAIAAVLGVLTFTPMSFQVACDGQLVPSIRRDVFAPTNGIVTKLHVTEDPDQIIPARAPLLDLTSETLLDAINQLEGRRRQLEQRMETIRRETVENYSQLSLVEEQQLQSQLEEAKTEFEGLGQSLRLKQAEVALLKVESPIEGTLIDWQVTKRLDRRYVKSGQILVSMVDPTGPWQVELALPEKSLQHVRNRQRETDEPVGVTFSVASLPGTSFHGTIEWIDDFATVDPDAGNSVQVRVKINKEDIPAEVRVAGARVTAKVDCGYESAGYVLFHDVWDAWQSRVMFWIW